MKQSDRLGYMNCRFRAVKQFTTWDNKIRSYGRCNKDGKSCPEWYMVGFDCSEIREEDEV